MASVISDSGPVELAKSDDGTPGTLEEQLHSTSANEPENSQKSHSVIGSDASGTTEETSVREGIADGRLLGEVRGSLQTISNGVEELANTVQDLLGLSESDTTSGSDDDPDGHTRLSFAKLRSRARTRRRARRRLRDPRGRGQDTSTEDDTDSDDERSKKDRKIRLEIRECNFEQFQSVPADSRHELYCADILIADDSLSNEIQDFKDVVAKIGSGTMEPWKPDQVSKRTEDRITKGTENNKWIRRIRINSPAVMKMLGHLCSGSKKFKGKPTVFIRPFQLLVSSYPEFKENLTKMKRVASSVPDDRTDSTDLVDPGDVSTARTPDLDSSLRELGENKNAFQELTCFVDFMEARIMPDSRKYRDPSSTRPETIRYEDLWYLFKPGDLVYSPQDSSSSDRFKSSAFSQRILRVIQTRLTSTSPGKPLRLSYDGAWWVVAHFIEHDGTSYVPTYVISPRILPFLGEKKVTDLALYPLSYLEDDTILAQAESDGATYVNLIERRSGYYSGWTQTTDPFGRPLPSLTGTPSGNRSVSPEHIESDILVDFKETFNAFPGWKLVAFPEGGWEDTQTGVIGCDQLDLPLLEWNGTGERKRRDQLDRVLSRDTTEATDALRFMKEDAFGQFRKDTRTAPTGRHRVLLPGRFFAYAVLQRKFVQLNTRFVRSADLEANDKAFEKLEIDRNYKRLILSLVKSHFEKVETEKKTNTEIGTQDLIRGKGKGVVILLHGVPGVGKTATAEAVALKWKKPLFPITCGDLGFTAETLEKSLSEIFRLAHHWGCILLLDEADVFITRRERHDLKRNALVSAFLRVLEYYNGIIFLTTNRAGVLDEAVKSRVHLNLYYDHLNEEQTVAIFRQHIQRLRDIERQRNPNQNEQIMVLHKEIIQFARDHFNQRNNINGSDSNIGRWNGRQIRNAFLIASSLAHYDSEDEGGDEETDELEEPGRKKQKQLGRSQFEIVAQTTLMYDQYRASVHSGKSDEHVAFEREERAMSSQPRSPTPVRMKNISKSFS